jgi:7,8-dihydropterin-6-yl-methyl-4-(beta-D-ribofuranosyl)aminobenzene 5'-phosphate synthase
MGDIREERKGIQGALTSLTVTIVAEDSVGYETPYLGQHGVSFLLRAVAPGEARVDGPSRRDGTVPDVTRTILVDVAQHPGPLLHNLSLMGVDPGEIDTIVLTHCHYDHTQGLVEVLKAVGRPDIPVIAHPDLFRLNFSTWPELRHIGVMNSDTEEKIHAAGGMLFPTREPLQIMPGVVAGGEVPRTTDYENRETALKTVRAGRITTDEMVDEQSLYCVVEGVGTVVVTGCSHPGVVNIVVHAKELSGTPITAVIGGFHLIESTEERIGRTVEDLQKEKVERVMAGHCTGFPAQARLYEAFGDRFTPLRTGQTFSFPPGR